MKWTIAGLMLAGVIAALSATILTASLRAERRVSTRGKPAEPRQVTIIVASRNLEAMSHIDADATVDRVVPEEEVPQGAITSQLRVIGRILALPMVEGQPFLDKSFAPDYAGIHLASALPEGGRAMSITLSATNTIERLLYPGCLVDVVASFRLPGFGGRASGEVVSSTVLQGVTVLAVGDRSVTDSASAGPGEARLEPADRNLVTLLVDATQAEALQLATTHGTVTLALRNPGDTGESTASGMMLSDLSALLAERMERLKAEVETQAPPPAATAPPEPPQWKTVVLRGGVAETRLFPLEEPDLALNRQNEER